MLLFNCLFVLYNFRCGIGFDRSYCAGWSCDANHLENCHVNTWPQGVRKVWEWAAGGDVRRGQWFAILPFSFNRIFFFREIIHCTGNLPLLSKIQRSMVNREKFKFQNVLIFWILKSHYLKLVSSTAKLKKKCIYQHGCNKRGFGNKFSLILLSIINALILTT